MVRHAIRAERRCFSKCTRTAAPQVIQQMEARLLLQSSPRQHTGCCGARGWPHSAAASKSSCRCSWRASSSSDSGCWAHPPPTGPAAAPPPLPAPAVPLAPPPRRAACCASHSSKVRAPSSSSSSRKRPRRPRRGPRPNRPCVGGGREGEDAGGHRRHPEGGMPAAGRALHHGWQAEWPHALATQQRVLVCRGGQQASPLQHPPASPLPPAAGQAASGPRPKAPLLLVQAAVPLQALQALPLVPGAAGAVQRHHPPAPGLSAAAAAPAARLGCPGAAAAAVVGLAAAAAWRRPHHLPAAGWAAVGTVGSRAAPAAAAVGPPAAGLPAARLAAAALPLLQPLSACLRLPWLPARPACCHTLPALDQSGGTAAAARRRPHLRGRGGRQQQWRQQLMSCQGRHQSPPS